MTISNRLQTGLGQFGCRLVPPAAATGTDNRFRLQRPDGSVATLLESESFRLETLNAECGDAVVPPELAELGLIPKMSTHLMGAIFNYLVRCMDPAKVFVNVGVWNGYSLLAAMLANETARIDAIDNFSQFGGPRDEFLGRFLTARTNRHRFFDQDYLDYFCRGLSEPIGVYFYDGEHSYGNQRKALEVAEPFFADDCVVVVDDTNWNAPRSGTLDFAEASDRDYTVLVDVRTAGQHPTFWNGLLILQSGAESQDPLDFEPHLPWITVTDEVATGNAGTQDVVVSLIVPSGIGDVDLGPAPEGIDVEYLVVGESAGIPGEKVASSFEDAVCASVGSLLGVLPRGIGLPPNAIARAVQIATSTTPLVPFGDRNQSGRHMRMLSR